MIFQWTKSSLDSQLDCLSKGSYSFTKVAQFGTCLAHDYGALEDL